MTSAPALAPDDPALLALRQLEALLRAAMGADALLLPRTEPLPEMPLGAATVIPVPGTPAPMDDAARIIAAMRDAVFCYGPAPTDPPAEPPPADAFWDLTASPANQPHTPAPVAEGEAGPVVAVAEGDGVFAFTDPATGATARILLAPPVPEALWLG